MGITTVTGQEYLNYVLHAAGGDLPSGLSSVSVRSPVTSWDINPPPAQSFHYANPYGDTQQFLGQRLSAFEKSSDGSETQFLSDDFTRGLTGSVQDLTADRQLRTTLDYDIGYSYVAMGEWTWRVVDLDGNTAGDAGDLMFVNGDRTPASGVPVSGTATYDAHSLELFGSSGSRGIPFTLTADFGRRTMSTQIDQDYVPPMYATAEYFAAPGVHVSGSAPFSNDGSFDIPLTGTAAWASEDDLVPNLASQPVTGKMDGALFGPHAEQVGGVFSLLTSAGQELLHDAFVGRQH